MLHFLFSAKNAFFFIDGRRSSTIATEEPLNSNHSLYQPLRFALLFDEHLGRDVIVRPGVWVRCCYTTNSTELLERGKKKKRLTK